MSAKITLTFSWERYLKVMDLLYFVDRRIDMAVSILEPLEKKGKLNEIPDEELLKKIVYAKEVLKGEHDLTL